MSPLFAREVNKNNSLGGQCFNIFAQKFRKIINWVGSLQFLSALTQNNVFLSVNIAIPPFQLP